MSDSDSFKKNTFLLTFGTIINKGLQFAVIPFFSRWLSTEEYGQFDLIVTYVSLLLPVITLSNHEGIFRMCVGEEDNKKKRGYISAGLIIDIIGYAFFTIILFAAYGRNHKQLFLSFSLYLLGEVALVYLRGVLRAMKKLDVYSFVLIFSTAVMIICVTISVLVLNMGLNGIVSGYALGSVIGAIFVAIWVKWWRWVSLHDIKITSFRNMLSYSVPLIPNDLSWWIINASDRQIINIFFGDAANGIYAIAHKIPAICSIIFSMVALSWQQEISVSIEKEKKIDINGYLNSMITILCSFCILLLACSFILYRFIFDKKYYEATNYSPILIVSSAVLAVSLFMGGILAAYKRSKSNGISTVVGAVTNIVFHLILIRYIGLFAAAISTLMSNIVNLSMRIFILRDVYRVEITRKALVSFAIMTYFFAVAYYDKNIVFNCVNLVCAIVIALYLNKKMLSNIYSRFKRC